MRVCDLETSDLFVATGFNSLGFAVEGSAKANHASQFNAKFLMSGLQLQYKT
jgi:hypothetical protein